MKDRKQTGKRSIFHMRYFMMVFLFIAASVSYTYAQEKTLKGIITDETGEAIIGASVSIKGTTTGTVSDLDGNFTLKVKDSDVLTISYVGYMNQEMRVAGQSEIKIVLKEDSHMLDELVVIGYGTIKKSDLTGAVSRMDAEKIGERPIARVEQALQGALSGVQVRTITGEPGQDLNIRVRGAASINASANPLYVVDGVPTSTLIGLNPSDISSMEVLKDAASAAIYGSRGSNGVIIITTKKGKSGKPKITFSATYGIQNLENKVDLLTGQEWIDFYIKYNDANYLNQARNKGVTNASIKDPNNVRMQNIGGNISKPDYKIILDDRWFNYVSQDVRDAHTYQATNEELAMLDWQDKFYRTAPVMDFNVNLSGGNDGTTYMFSAGYFDQDGIATGTNYKRMSLRANVESKINTWLTAGIKLAPTYSKRTGAGRANGKDSEAHKVLSSSPVSPIDVGYMTNVEPNAKYEWAGSPSSPWYVMKTNLRNDDEVRVAATGYLRITPLEGLQIEGTAATNYYDLDGQTYTYSAATGSWAQGEGAASSGGHNTKRRFDNSLLQVVGNYTKSLGKHNLNFMMGASAEQSNWGYETDQTFNKPFPNDAFPESFDGSKLPIGKDIVTKNTPDKMISYFGRLQYDFDSKYLLSVSLRRDGGSVFGTNNKWGTFPAISGAWKISDETFFKNLNWNFLNMLKLRASYGVTGNKEISRTAAYSMMASSMYAGQFGYTSNTLGNPDLGWEKAHSTDVAIDLSLFDNRIQLSADWYTKKTTDLLYQVPVQGASGFTTVWDNLGDIKNQGFEIELNTRNLTGEFNWSTSFNFSYNKNEVLSLGVDNTPVYSGFNSDNISNILEVGRPINTFYMYEAIGVWRTQKEIDEYSAAHGGKPVTFKGATIKPGDIRYRDVNNDGIFTEEEDRAYLGSPTPTCTYGMTNTFAYKNFDLSILLTAQTGGKIFGIIGRAIDRPGQGPQTNAFGWWKNAWWSEEDQGDGKTPYPLSTTTGATVDSRWLYSSDYLRIKNITLGYTIPINKNIISNARIYASVENLLTFSKYDGGYSPEASNSGASGAPGGSTALGIDYGSYPLARAFTFGLNLTF